MRIFWGHHENDGVVGGPSIELQRMASVSGLSYWEETSFLSLHPKYGPWFALRAVIVFDGIEYTGVSQHNLYQFLKQDNWSQWRPPGHTAGLWLA